MKALQIRIANAIVSASITTDRKYLIGILITGTLSGCGNPSQENTEIAAETEGTTDNGAEPEDGTSYYEEGRACLYGLDGKEIDLETACVDFEKALELGKTEANFYLGALYYCYNYPERDNQKAKTYFEAAGVGRCGYCAGVRGRIFTIEMIPTILPRQQRPKG